MLRKKCPEYQFHITRCVIDLVMIGAGIVGMFVLGTADFLVRFTGGGAKKRHGQAS